MSGRVFLKSFSLVSEKYEAFFMRDLHSTCYSTIYPYKIFSLKDFYDIEFAPITIFYGGNGCGKTTLLNIIAEKLKLKRLSPFNVSPFFDNFVDGCSYEGRIPSKSRILTSDDVFDYLLNIRNLNIGIDTRREELFDEWIALQNSSVKFDPLTSIEEYDKWIERAKEKKLSQSEYVRRKLGTNVDMRSNGESAIRFWAEQIDSDALYLLDEPENSLSITKQKDLKSFLQDSAENFGCQFVISTHSPILLSLEGAKIYDLDDFPVECKKWTELENVKSYYEFFCEHSTEFANDN